MQFDAPQAGFSKDEIFRSIVVERETGAPR
jgi:hypothetical protein